MDYFERGVFSNLIKLAQSTFLVFDLCFLLTSLISSIEDLLRPLSILSVKLPQN